MTPKARRLRPGGAADRSHGCSRRRRETRGPQAANPWTAGGQPVDRNRVQVLNPPGGGRNGSPYGPDLSAWARSTQSGDPPRRTPSPLRGKPGKTPLVHGFRSGLRPALHAWLHSAAPPGPMRSAGHSAGCTSSKLHGPPPRGCRVAASTAHLIGRNHPQPHRPSAKPRFQAPQRGSEQPIPPAPSPRRRVSSAKP